VIERDRVVNGHNDTGGRIFFGNTLSRKIWSLSLHVPDRLHIGGASGNARSQSSIFWHLSRPPYRSEGAFERSSASAQTARMLLWLLRISCLREWAAPLIHFSLFRRLILNLHRHYNIPSPNQQFLYCVSPLINSMPFLCSSWPIAAPQSGRSIRTVFFDCARWNPRI
jgi:hypothetical protein